MLRIISALLIFVLACLLMAARVTAELSISAPVHGAKLTIRSSARTAGAIDSLTWNNREFLNSYDHGRELQSASSFDGYGECLNPTEAGSAADGTGPASSSRLLFAKARARELETTIEMAYWIAPGAAYRGACGSHKDVHRAVNESVRSQDLLTKRVRIGVKGAPDAISYDVTYTTAADRQSGTFEALTAYMTPEFSEFLTWNPATGELDPLSDGPGEQKLPVIFSTPDHRFAMGIVSPDSSVGYGRWRFRDTVKWNSVFRVSPVPRGEYRFRCYVVVGTLENVRRTLAQLNAIPSGLARHPKQ